MQKINSPLVPPPPAVASFCTQAAFHHTALFQHRIKVKCAPWQGDFEVSVSQELLIGE